MTIIKKEIILKKILLGILFALNVSPCFSQVVESDVAQIRYFSAGENVVLTGRLVEHINGADYWFEDYSGYVVVVIEEGIWQEQRVTTDSIVEIFGMVDNDFITGPKIYVDRLIVIQ